jgi:MoaA/NifB/PqqE/SkfB family radical SAM enzyme
MKNYVLAAFFLPDEGARMPAPLESRVQARVAARRHRYNGTELQPMRMSELRPNQRNKYLALWELAHDVAQVESIPASLQFAKNNTCNFKCVYCIDHRPGNQIPRTRLEGQVWENLLDLIPKSAELGFHGISEFFVDPDFFDILRRCAEAGAALSLNTNGSVCTPRHLDALANYPGPIWITFSLDAATPETFLRIRGQEFWRILRNVRTYIDRFEARRQRTGIALSFVINRSSVKEMLPFVYLAKALKADVVSFFRMHEYDGLTWEAETRHGGVFNYREECVGKFQEEYNLELERVRKAAATLGVVVELPAPVPSAELVDISR